jgi:hypothetical protein
MSLIVAAYDGEELARCNSTAVTGPCPPIVVVIRCLEEEKCMYQHRGRRIVVAFTLASALLVPVISAGAQAPAPLRLVSVS